MSEFKSGDVYKELTLKDVILFVKSYLDDLLLRWKWILIAGIFLGILFAFVAYFQPKTYKEQLTFMMDETASKKGNMFESLALLGDLFGSGNSGDNLGKILQLFESKKIIHSTLFDTTTINGKTDFLANHFIKLYSIETLVKDYKYFNSIGFKIGWPQKLLKTSDFQFTHGNFEEFTPKENQFLRLIYEKVNGNPRVGISPALNSELNEKTGIMTLSMVSEYEDLTLGVLNNIYKQLSYFFITKSVEKQKKTYDIMTFKRDSVLSELKTAEYRLADFKDSNRKLVTVKGYLNQLKLEREVTILNIMYGEVVKQLEITDFTLRNMTPVVQIIDLPRRPIVWSKPSWIKKLLTYGIIGAILACIFFVIRKFFRDVMA